MSNSSHKNCFNLIKKNLFKLILSIMVLAMVSCGKEEGMPEGFVFLQDVEPSIIEHVRYYGKDNFLGKQVPGYTANRIICTKQAAKKLQAVQKELQEQGYVLVVYDGYRPQRAVNEFVRWSKDDSDQVAKEFYYSTIDKRNAFKLGYIAEKSGHSRGSTFDLTIIKADQQLKPILITKRSLKNEEEISFLDDNTVDMGSSFDLFHEVSYHDTPLVDEQYITNRNILRQAMKNHGFNEYAKEWWHYTLANEPYPNTYFDFIVK